LSFSHEALTLLKTLSLDLITIPVFLLNSPAQYSTSLLSKSSPPKWVLSFIVFTSNKWVGNFGWLEFGEYGGLFLFV